MRVWSFLLKVLITGSSGQIGTNLALALIAKGETVLGIDRRLNTWTDKIPMLTRDLAAEGMPTLPPEFGLPDVVIHLAANAKVHELVKNPSRAHENATTAFHVLEFCRQYQLPIIFSSSREVYGHGKPPTVAEEAINPYEILSPYAAYKLADEMLIYSYAHCYDLKYLVFRLSNVYGRYDNDVERMTRVLHVFINRMLRHEPITIFDRHKVIDFTYIDDCIQGIMLGIEHLLSGAVVNETMNLSSGSPASLGHLAETIANCLEVTPQIIDKPIQAGEINFYIADLTKTKQLLGFDPQMPFEEGIKWAVAWSLDWHKEHGTYPPPSYD